MIFKNKVDLSRAHTICIAGQKGTGKTYALMALFSEIKDRNVIVFDTLGVFKPKIQQQSNYIFCAPNFDMNAQHFQIFIKNYLCKIDWKKNNKIIFNTESMGRSGLVNLLNFISLYLLEMHIKCALLVDEIADYCRQGKAKPYAHDFDRLARVGRNYGVSPIIMTTQRTQYVEKDILGLCDYFVCFRIRHKLDRDKIKDAFGLDVKEFAAIEKKLMAMQPQEVFLQDIETGAVTETRVKDI